MSTPSKVKGQIKPLKMLETKGNTSKGREERHQTLAQESVKQRLAVAKARTGRRDAVGEV